AGTARVFTAPCDAALGGPPTSRHVMGTLRMGADAATSVTRPDGRFHDVSNLYCCDGSVFPTSAGWNPSLTIVAVSLKTAHGSAGGGATNVLTGPAGGRSRNRMLFGIQMFSTHYAIRPDELAREAEARGFESLWFPEHTHIPVSRRSPWPGGPVL